MKAARLFLFLFASLPIACGSAQDGEQARQKLHSRPQPVDAQAGGQVVTRGEAAKAFAEAGRALGEVLKLPSPQFGVLFAGDAGRPLRKSETILAIHRLYEHARPKFCYTPRMVSYEPSRITLPASDPARGALEELIRWQVIAKLGPLAAGDRSTLTVDELGDALGFALARLADLTHMPSTRWSPYLMDDEGVAQDIVSRSKNGSSSE